MPNLTDTDLRDPSPPVPGARERAAVATRAHQLGRHRRMMQGAGALGMVAVVAVGVAALTAGGTSPGPGGQRIEAASSATDAPNATPATTAVPAPAPVSEEQVAPSGPVLSTVNPEPVVPTAAPTSFSVSGTVSNVPAGVTLTLTLTGSTGTFTAIADGSGHFSIGGVPAGEYTASYEWVSTDGTATQVGKLGGVTISSDIDVSFALQ